MPDGAALAHPAAAHAPLSSRLREATAASHAQLERATAGASSLTSPGAYALYLARHYAVFAPLEAQLARLSGWRRAGIDLPAHRRLPALLADLAALQVDPAAIQTFNLAPPANLAAGFGALYVLEGSALGGKVILRDIQPRLGAAIAGATAFFSGAAPGLPWPQFKARLDAYGHADPGAQPQVIAGALATFAAFARAFTSAAERGASAP